jgi:hypothetical protein
MNSATPLRQMHSKSLPVVGWHKSGQPRAPVLDEPCFADECLERLRIARRRVGGVEEKTEFSKQAGLERANAKIEQTILSLI